MFSFMKSSAFLYILREKITNQHSKFLLYYHVVYCFIREGIELQNMIYGSMHGHRYLLADLSKILLLSLNSSFYMISHTWFRTAAIVWLPVISSWESWSFPGKKEGVLRVTTKGSNCFYCKSSICHSVIIFTPEFFVQNAQSFNNVTNKCYCSRILLWMVKLNGFWQNNPVQSTITLVIGYVSLKHSAIVSVTMS